MMRTIFKREILQNLYSLRFVLSLALVLVVFAAGSLSYVRSHETSLAKAREIRGQALEAMRADAEANATELAVSSRTYTLFPRTGAFIHETKEKYLPNSITYSAWNVFAFQNRSGSANPFLAKFDELSWTTIAALILSFISLLFTFDALSGEKETKTLALTLSNPVSRGTLLWGKYLSAVVSVLMLLLAGVLVSLLIIVISGAAEWSGSLAAETFGFFITAGLMVAALAAFGLFCSVISRSSNISLLLALSVWLLFVVVIPNSSAFIAKNLYPIAKTDAVQARVEKAFDDLDKAAPEGSWMMNSGNPFLPQHELRANLQRKRLEAEKAIRDDYYRDVFRQFERTRFLTAVSPVSAFEYLSEAVVGGGYPRFQKVWNDLHTYQAQFLEFFKTIDARDPKSPHWYNPSENVSTTRLPVAFATVPQFVEKPMSFVDRARPALVFLAFILIPAAVFYLLTFFLFVRYDVR